MNELVHVVAAGDTDLVAYMYHVNFLRQMEAARWNLLGKHIPQLELAELAARTVVRSVACEFCAPAAFGDTLIWDADVSVIGDTSYGVDFTCYVNDRSRVASRGTSTQVYLDRSKAKGEPLPSVLRRALEAAMVEQ